MISILIIGDEILSAQVEDSNLKEMLAELNRRHYQIDEVRIVPDDLPVISDAIRALSQKSDFLISTGGVGPTHDDITLDAYAAAYDTEMILHPELESRIRRFFGNKEVKPATLRMATVPANTELIDVGPDSWPLVKVGNCFVLPGLPEVFRKKFRGVLEVLPEKPERHFAEIFTKTDESDFAAAVTEVQNTWPGVAIGSYPTYDRSVYAAHITMKSTSLVDLNLAYDKLEALFKQLNSLVRSAPPRKAD